MTRVTDLKGKLALVTGATAGIGLAGTIQIAELGATVIVAGRSQKSVDEAVADIRNEVPGADVKTLVADLGTRDGCDAIIGKFPAVDILVNNLGIYEAVGFFDETDEAWYHLFEVNVMSGVRLSRHYLRGMLEKKWGRLIFISSESGITPAPEVAHYSATKAMQISLGRSLSELTKGTAVTVNTILPGPTRTPGVEKFIGDIFPGVPSAEAERKFIEANRPTSLIQRLIDPVEVGAMIAYIASPKSSATNGAALRVEGGLVRTMI